MMKKILFYVDSFGLGHITRQIAVARAIGKKAECVFAIRDHAWILNGSLPDNRIVETDIGLNLVPKGLGIDIEKTRAANIGFLERFENNVKLEKKRIETEAPDVIVADIPAEPFLAAEESGIPIVAVSNFGWTVIIEHVFGKNSIEYGTYANAYSKSTQTLIIPFNEPMEPFKNKKKVGLLRRRITRSLPRKQGVLSTFGRSGELDAGGSLFYRIPDSEIETQDIVAVAEAVFTKPSYGIISETVSTGIPLFLRGRPGFPEADHILRSIEGAKLVPEDASPEEWIRRELKNIDRVAIERMQRKYKKNSDEEIAAAILGVF